MIGLMAYGALTRINGQKDRYVQVRESELHSILRLLMLSIDVDEAWYRGKYSDIAEAIDSGRVESGRAHYLDVGYFENRLPRKFVVDANWYMRAYPDVAEAIKRGVFSNPQEHFDDFGFKEGRLPYPDWSL